MFPESEYHRDVVLKIDHGYSFYHFKEMLMDPKGTQMSAMLLTNDENELFSEYMDSKFKYRKYIFLAPLLNLYHKIPSLKNIRFLKLPVFVLSVGAPYATYRYTAAEY